MWLITIALLALLAFVFLGWYFGTYNIFVTGKQNIKEQWSNIKTEYQRRADLFFNLVEAVKSYKKFEKETMVDVVKARSGSFGNTKQQQVESMKKLDSSFSNLFSGLKIAFERYPKLKSSEQHNKLMDEVRITEDRINIARTDYNEVVRSYNLSVQTFPSNILAHRFGFKEENYFKNDEASDKPVRIKLD